LWIVAIICAPDNRLLCCYGVCPWQLPEAGCVWVDIGASMASVGGWLGDVLGGKGISLLHNTCVILSHICTFWVIILSRLSYDPTPFCPFDVGGGGCAVVVYISLRCACVVCRGRLPNRGDDLDERAYILFQVRSMITISHTFPRLITCPASSRITVYIFTHT